MHVRVFVSLKNGVLDPQGKAIEQSASRQGHDKITKVRQGKMFDLEIKASSEEEAEREAIKIAQDLLANQVMENFTIQVI